MGVRVLVAFATKHGSTREVAAEIARVIETAGHDVELLPAGEAKDVSRFGLVVVGAPLYAGKWHKDVARLLKRHRAALTAVPSAVFALGPRAGPEESRWARSQEQLDRALARHDWFHPVAVELFGGVDPPGKRERRDQRDWEAIRAWATMVAGMAR